MCCKNADATAIDQRAANNDMQSKNIYNKYAQNNENAEFARALPKQEQEKNEYRKPSRSLRIGEIPKFKQTVE